MFEAARKNIKIHFRLHCPYSLHKLIIDEILFFQAFAFIKFAFKKCTA